MPLFGPTYYCPNAKCEFDKALKQGATCPNCGAEAKPFGMRDWAALFATKKTYQQNASAGQKGAAKSGKGGYYCPNPTCANVKELREGEKCPACGTEAQSDDIDEPPPPAKPGEGGIPLFTSSTTDAELEEKIRLGVGHLNEMGPQAAAYEQSNIIIMQNELILRHLRKK